MDRRRGGWVRALGHAVGLAPLALLAYWYTQGALGVNPIRELVLRSGRYGAALLVLSLVPTAVRIATGHGRALALRGIWGLYAFGYAVGHLVLQVGLDYQFALDLWARDVLRKRFGLAGAGALLLLVPLAVTSTRGWQRRLGRGWVRLHRLVYLGAALDVIHYAWAVKASPRIPYALGGVLSALLIVRLPPVRRALGRARARAAQE